MGSGSSRSNHRRQAAWKLIKLQVHHFAGFVSSCQQPAVDEWLAVRAQLVGGCLSWMGGWVGRLPRVTLGVGAAGAWGQALRLGLRL